MLKTSSVFSDSRVIRKGLKEFKMQLNWFTEPTLNNERMKKRFVLEFTGYRYT